MTRPTFRDPRQVLRARGLWAKKHFGQNFLVSPHVPERIAEAGGVEADDVAFEIGPGCGTLTHALAARAGRLIALEHDRDMLDVSREELAWAPHAEIRGGNVLDVDWPSLAEELGQPPVIYGNLPYHLSTPILVGLLESTASWKRGCFMVQLEFAQRLCASPGEKACGRLSALAALWSRARIAFRVSAGAFHPRPKVESAVVVMEPRREPAESVGDPRVFGRVVAALFGQRRKTARNALKALLPDAAATLEAAGLDPRRRGETFSLAELAALSRAVSGDGQT